MSYDSFQKLKRARIRAWETRYFTRLVEQHGWKVKYAALAAGMDRANLLRKLRQLGIKRPGKEDLK